MGTDFFADNDTDTNGNDVGTTLWITASFFTMISSPVG
jgi:hypothetical protein